MFKYFFQILLCVHVYVFLYFFCYLFVIIKCILTLNCYLLIIGHLFCILENLQILTSVKMPYKYDRKSKRASWKVDDLDAAIARVRDGDLSLRQASQYYHVPKSTIGRYLKGSTMQPGRLGRNPVLDDEHEQELVHYLIVMQKFYQGITPDDLKKLVYQLAERNGIEHPFSKRKESAGKDWMHSFLKRHQQLSIRQPEPTSINRTTGFRIEAVTKFFDLLEDEMRKKKFPASRIWNADESGITVIQKPGKIIAQKGQKQVGKQVSGERGRTITVMCAMSAGGNFCPPIMIFPRARMNNNLMIGAPEGAVGCVSSNGWINEDIFLQWLNHFIAFTHASRGQPQLLILDGHCSHKTLAAIDLARESGVTIITLPPHCTHAMQPLDVVFYGPMKTFYNQECDRWMARHPGMRITDYEVAGLFNGAYIRTASVQKATNGFKACGIFPVEREIITAKLPDIDVSCGVYLSLTHNGQLYLCICIPFMYPTIYPT